MYFAAKVENEKCKGCKLCIFACPEANVIDFDSAKAKVFIHCQRCKGCGLCVETCPVKAIVIAQVT